MADDAAGISLCCRCSHDRATPSGCTSLVPRHAIQEEGSHIAVRFVGSSRGMYWLSIRRTANQTKAVLITAVLIPAVAATAVPQRQ